MKSSSGFLFSPMNVWLIHIVCLIGYSPSTELALQLPIGHIGVDLILSFHSITLILIYCGYKIDDNGNRVIPSTLFFLYKIILPILSPLSFYANFSISPSICAKKLSGTLIRVLFNCTYMSHIVGHNWSNLAHTNTCTYMRASQVVLV